MVAALALASCERFAGYAPAHGPDGGRSEAGLLLDLSAPLDALFDAPGDGPLVGDSLVTADTGGDASSEEIVAPDLQPMNDGTSTGTCLQDSVPYKPAAWDPSMVICEGAVADQCAAAALCNASAGWHLCNVSEYRALGGLAGGWSPFGWIAGCIRTGPQPHAPEDGLCDSACSQKSTQQFAVLGWYCQMGTMGWSLQTANVGLTTFNHCVRAGVDTDASAAYWRPRDVTLTGDGAVCCR